ncbi:hypothetical protein [Kribbella italica]|uniref:Uncharacterized protein n=1 Tax=Kribbella italica TaxID=1540520 RepID=A0A7W9J1L8_9ACTN|nr:hypothetical protein [Kribbella italica]MBB5833397.1 hypothetical protein [Kribbella italica]
MESVGYTYGDLVEGYGPMMGRASESMEQLHEIALTGWHQFRSFSSTFNLIEVNPATLRLLYGLPAERCDYSWLWPNECAHCLGHELPDDVPVQQS